ncbi:MAG: hypothetical protein ACYSTF_07525 [Planctomycetota bacterium]|jgi:Tol biopolymer transport system component
MKTKSLVMLTLLVLVVATRPLTGEAPGAVDSKVTLVTRETSLAEFEEGQPIRADATVSLDNRRIADVRPEGPKGYRMVVNGVPGKLYDVISTSGRVFSPDGQRLAYVAGQKERKYFVVLDDVEGVDGYMGIGNLTFSSDSRRFAYSAWDSDAKKAFVFLDGEKGEEYDEIMVLVFSPDGQRLASVASRGDKRLVVVDGSEGREYDSIAAGPLFSPDSKHVTYTARRNGKGVFVRDGVESPEFGSVLSPDGKRMAYHTGGSGSKQRVVLDGKRGKLYEMVAGLKFSPDGKRFAYSAWSDDGMYAVIDSQEQQFYDALQDIIFSPDGKRVAFSALSVEKKGVSFESFVVVDGVEGKRYRWGKLPAYIKIPPAVFSPDSKHVAYVVEKEDEAWVVVDGVEGRHYEEVWKERMGGSESWEKSLVFSADGRIAYWAKRDRRWRIVVDGVESKEYWRYLQFSKLVFETPNLLSGVAFGSRGIVRVEIEIKED